MQEYLIPLVNEAFGKHYSPNARVSLKPMKQVTRGIEGSLNRRDTDSMATIIEDSDHSGMDYHFECEAWPGNAIAIRIAEYAVGSAFQSVKLTEMGAEMFLPYSAVIFLRADSLSRDALTMTIHYPGGTASYNVPVIRIRSYSIDSLFEKKLLLLLPFYAFNFEKDLGNMDSDSTQIHQLMKNLDDICGRLSLLAKSKEINEYQKAFLMEIMNRVFQKMAIKYQNITKGVDQVMGGYIIKTYADEILEKGIEQGIEQGIKRGIGQGIEQGTNRTMLYAVDNYVTKLHVSEKEACETLGFDYSEFLKAKDVPVS
ncbi:MAG: hypothetical protein K6E18_11275 [Lachnospiraceae bacterium]|nr:hypothetical protein [Lachnospiraceae bacterium]